MRRFKFLWIIKGILEDESFCNLKTPFDLLPYLKISQGYSSHESGNNIQKTSVLTWKCFLSTMTNSFMVKRRNKYFIHHMHCMCIFFSSFILLLIFTLMSSLDLCKNIWGNVWWLQNWFTFKWGALLLFSKHFMSRWKSNKKGYM